MEGLSNFRMLRLFRTNDPETPLHHDRKQQNYQCLGNPSCSESTLWFFSPSHRTKWPIELDEKHYDLPDEHGDILVPYY